MYTLVGTKDLDFMGSDGKQVNGVNLFFTYEDERVRGVATERVFVHTTVILDFSEYAIIGQISRWTSTIGFCLMLAGATKRLIWTA